MNLLMTILTNREDIFDTLPVWLEQADGPINYGVIVDDGGSPQRHQRLHERFGDLFTIVPTYPGAESSVGFNGAMRKVMVLVHEYRPDYVFHLEEDFLPERKVDVGDLARLAFDRKLLQVALLRQPWFPNEDEHGGVIEAREAQGAVFHRMHDGRRDWIEHRDHITLNPMVFPGELAVGGWPQGAWSESAWGQRLFLQYPMSCAAYWGANDGPWVRHIGERTGFDY